MKLSNLAIKQAKSIDRDYTLSDGGGLYILIKKTGSKLWRYGFRFNGKPRLLALGRYPETTLKHAREKHLQARRLLEHGIDPCQDKQAKKERENISKNCTVMDLCEKFINDKKVTQGRIKILRSFAGRRIYPIIGNLPVCDLNVETLIGFFEELKKFNQQNIFKWSVHILSGAFTIAIALGIVDRNPINDIKSIIPRAVSGHWKSLDEKKLSGFLKDVFSREPTVPIVALRLLLFSMVRVSEVVSAEWKDVDLDNGVWTIPYTKMKMGKNVINPDTTNHIIPLPRQAVEMLRAIPKNNGFIFPNIRTQKGAMWRDTVLRQIKIYDTTVH